MFAVYSIMWQSSRKVMRLPVGRREVGRGDERGGATRGGGDVESHFGLGFA
jgi:hypothetical protein